jgi:hypothetical protein
LPSKARRGGTSVLEIWQLPSPPTPRLASPEQVATLQGTPLRLVEARLVKRLARAGINLATALPNRTAAGRSRSSTR